MTRYSLNQLGDSNFEALCQAVLLEVISKEVTPFGDGPDGAREATFSGKASYPNDKNSWEGEWVFQVKFHDTEIIGSTKARKEVLKDLDRELKKITSKYKHKCDNYILLTNVTFSGVDKKGTHDKVNSEIIPKYKQIRNIAYWDGRKIEAFLDSLKDIRLKYGLESHSDVLDMIKQQTDEKQDLSSGITPDSHRLNIVYQKYSKMSLETIVSKLVKYEDEENTKFQKMANQLKELLDNNKFGQASEMIVRMEEHIEKISDELKAKFMNNKGVYYTAVRDYETAIDCFNKACSMDNQNYVFNSNRIGMSLMHDIDLDWDVELNKLEKLKRGTIKTKILKAKKVFYIDKDSKSAIVSLKKLSKKEKDAELFFTLGMFYGEVNNVDDAISVFIRVEGLDQVSADAKALLGKSYLMKACPSLEKDGSLIKLKVKIGPLNLIKARDKLLEALILFEKQGTVTAGYNAAVNLTVCLNLLDEYDECIKVFYKYSDRFDEKFELLRNVSYAFMKKKRMDLAKDAVMKAKELNRDSFDVNFEYCQLLFLSDDYKNFRIEVNKLFDTFSDSERFSGEEKQFLKSIYIVSLISDGLEEDFEEKIKEFEDSYRGSEYIPLVKAHYYEVKKDITTQEKLLLEAYEINENNTSVLHNLAKFYCYQLKNFDLVIKYYQKLREIIRLDEHSLEELCKCMFIKKKYEDLIALIDEDVIVTRRVYKLLYLKAQAEYILGDKNAAYESFKEYIRCNKNSKKVVIDFATLCIDSGNDEKAIELLERAIKSNDEEERKIGLLHLAQFYLMRGDKDKAYKKVCELISGYDSDSDVYQAFFFISMYTNNHNNEQFAIRLKEFNEKWPDDKRIQAIEVYSEDTPIEKRGEEILTNISSFLYPSVERRRKVEVFKKIYKIPLFFECSFLPLNYYELWRKKINSDEKYELIHIRTNDNEYKEDVRVAADSKIICIDYLAILTLKMLDQLEVLPKIYDKIIISRGVITEIRNDFIKTNDEFLKEILEEFQKDSYFINSSYFNMDISSSHPFGYEDTLQIVINDKVSLLSDEVVFREEIKQLGGVSFSTLELLDVIRDKEYISEIDFQQFQVSLAKSNYLLVRINLDLLYSLAEADDFDLMHSSRELLNALLRPFVIVESFLAIFQNLIIKFFQQGDAIPKYKKREWLLFISNRILAVAKIDGLFAFWCPMVIMAHKIDEKMLSDLFDVLMEVSFAIFKDKGVQLVGVEIPKKIISTIINSKNFDLEKKSGMLRSFKNSLPSDIRLGLLEFFKNECPEILD